MTKKPVHTIPTKTGWANKQSGEVISNHKTKEKAQEIGRGQVKKDHTEHVIHKKNGTIQNSNSYGSDPCPPKDKKWNNSDCFYNFVINQKSNYRNVEV